MKQKKPEVISTQRTTARKQNGTEQKKIHVEASNTCTFQNWWNENKKWWIKISVYLWHLEQQLLLLAINPKSLVLLRVTFLIWKRKETPAGAQRIWPSKVGRLSNCSPFIEQQLCFVSDSFTCWWACLRDMWSGSGRGLLTPVVTVTKVTWYGLQVTILAFCSYWKLKEDHQRRQ